jgi:hypothetical protein
VQSEQLVDIVVSERAINAVLLHAAVGVRTISPNDENM